MTSWHIYILECLDNTLYTGITNDLDARIEKHKLKTGAKYTRRGIKKLVYSEEVSSKSEALKREKKIKSLTREEKLELIKSSPSTL